MEGHFPRDPSQLDSPTETNDPGCQLETSVSEELLAWYDNIECYFCHKRDHGYRKCPNQQCEICGRPFIKLWNASEAKL